LHHKAEEFYPSPTLVKKCFEHHIPMTLGSDAHGPGQVGRHFDQALDLMRKTGFRHISTFTRRRRYDLPIPTQTPETQNNLHGGEP
jgi:histidinol-phosphatase (PHP family)